ncbi:hypothetical protein ACFVZ9_43935, partial [Streptomyces zaomyceticus]
DPHLGTPAEGPPDWTHTTQLRTNPHYHALIKGFGALENMRHNDPTLTHRDRRPLTTPLLNTILELHTRNTNATTPSLEKLLTDATTTYTNHPDTTLTTFLAATPKTPTHPPHHTTPTPTPEPAPTQTHLSPTTPHLNRLFNSDTHHTHPTITPATEGNTAVESDPETAVPLPTLAEARTLVSAALGDDALGSDEGEVLAKVAHTLL